MTKKYMILFILFFFITNIFAQSEREMYKEALNYINIKEYASAYEIMDKLYTKKPKNEDYLFTLGIICLNYPERKERALEIFQVLAKKNRIC